MNTLEATAVANPYGKLDECAKFTIDDKSEPFSLNGITVVDNEYTFSAWLKADAEGRMTVRGAIFPVTTEWAKHSVTFTATSENLPLVFGEIGTYYVYHPKLEIGNKVTDWTAAPEDVDQEINESIGDLRNVVDEQRTEIISTANEIVLSALNSYVETRDYNEFQQSVESRLSVMAHEISVNFSNAMTQLEEINGSLQSKYNQITAVFSVTIDGVTFGRLESPYKIFFDDDEFSMQVNDERVLWFRISENSHEANIPEVTITKHLSLLGIMIREDGDGTINAEYVGG